MCGIAGFIGQGDKKILSQMTDSIRHRGPDDEGFFVLVETHLGMRRLSIIDLAVEYHRDLPVLVKNRLLSARKVNNGEPPHAKMCLPQNKKTLIVRPPMPD